MSKEQPKNPLHGITLETIVTELVAHFGWPELGQQVSIKCFNENPSVPSSLKFLRKTPWAREKVESLYLFMLREKKRAVRSDTGGRALGYADVSFKGDIMGEKYRLVTRSDFDGLVCAMLLKELDMLDDILFVHPKDMQDGKVACTSRDITTNVPYVAGVHLAFDHHLSETKRVAEKPANHIIDPKAMSAARVVYDHYGGAAKFPRINETMMAEVDKADAAQFSKEDILDPSGWVMLNYLMDPRTGLGRFREFKVSNYQLMMALIDACLTKTIEEVLELPDVKERVALYREHEPKAKEQIQRCAKVHGNVVVLDLRNEETIWPTNRFAIYALFPQTNISIHVMWGLKKQNTVLAIGKSILDRGSKTNVGELALSYGGGGHEAAGTCQVENDKADEVLGKVVARLNADG